MYLSILKFKNLHVLKVTKINEIEKFDEKCKKKNIL